MDEKNIRRSESDIMHSHHIMRMHNDLTKIFNYHHDHYYHHYYYYNSCLRYLPSCRSSILTPLTLILSPPSPTPKYSTVAMNSSPPVVRYTLASSLFHYVSVIEEDVLERV